MRKSWYFINISVHYIFWGKSDCRAVEQRDGSDIVTLCLFFYVCCRSIQER